VSEQLGYERHLVNRLAGKTLALRPVGHFRMAGIAP
jgi:hypothetical protein